MKVGKLYRYYKDFWKQVEFIEELVVVVVE